MCVYECVALTHIARPLQACARTPGYEFFVNITKDNIRLGLFSAAGDCKLPAGTLKVSSPALNTCVGAVIQYSSIDRLCLSGSILFPLVLSLSVTRDACHPTQSLPCGFYGLESRRRTLETYS